MSVPLRTEVRGRVLVVTLDRPDAKNAVDKALAEHLLDALRRLDDDPALSLGVVTGSGGVFSAGMDLKAFVEGGAPKAFDEVLRRGSVKPLVAAVEGYAVGGGLEIALLCDLIVAGRSARLGLPEVRVGLFAAGGGLLRLPRRIPYGAAMEVALTGEPLHADAAHRLGLVNRVVDDGGALDAALDIAERIGQNAPLSLRATKFLLGAAAGATDEDFWEKQEPEVASVFTSADAEEGPRAFMERRPPVWTGR